MSKIERLRELADTMKPGPVIVPQSNLRALLDLVEKAKAMGDGMDEPCTCASHVEDPCSYCGPAMAFDDAYEKFDGGSDE